MESGAAISGGGGDSAVLDRLGLEEELLLLRFTPSSLLRDSLLPEEDSRREDSSLLEDSFRLDRFVVELSTRRLLDSNFLPLVTRS